MEDFGVGSVMHSERDNTDSLPSSNDAANAGGNASGAARRSTAYSFFKNISSIFTFGKDANKEAENEWVEFPWESIFIKTDIIKKWRKVNMKKIREIH